MLAVVQSVALVGVDGHLIRVEVGLTQGVPTFTIVGLPDAAVREARERVRAAIIASGHEWPHMRITVNLAPAGIPKSGSWFDLPIALGILTAKGDVLRERFEGMPAVGELGLGGELRPVAGVLPAALCAVRGGRRGIVVPAECATEASAVGSIEVVALSHLRQLLPGAAPVESPVAVSGAPPDERVGAPDLGDVAGQDIAKFAIEVAAAGAHHCLFVGEPGAGKTMLARRLPSILPPLSDAERLDASLVHSIAGTTRGLLTERPFRAPHHSASVAALVGGGSRAIAPGEISLAHNGVLFLDELGEFHPSVLDALRQPLEDGVVRVVRRGVRATLPARFMLVAATNPCPCGFAGSSRRVCRCDPAALSRYARRLSGPLLDRIDITVGFAPVSPATLLRHTPHGQSLGVRERVVAARRRQERRNGRDHPNASLTTAELRRLCVLDPEARDFLESVAGAASGRALHSVQKVACTIADLHDASSVARDDVELAWMLRTAGSFTDAPAAAAGLPT